MTRVWSCLLAGCLLAALYASSLYSYLLFHSIAELFSIVIACGTFMIAWNSRGFLKDSYLMVLGIAYLFIAGLDLAHTLAYRGMGVFPGYGTNLATQLWIAARFVQAFSLASVGLLISRQIKTELMIAVYGAVTVLLLSAIFVPGVFPDCFVEGRGLTPFKRASEYAICGILLVALGLLCRRRAHFDQQVFAWLAWSIILNIGSELAFTLYVDAYALSNLVGHYLKILSFYGVYKAIIQTALTQPYALLFRDLKQSEERYRAAQQELTKINASLEQKVQERTLKLQDTITELEQFSYSIVHDMRAPLRAMQSFAGLVLEDSRDKLDPQCNDYLQRVIAAAHRMDILIRDVLSYTKLARGEFEIAPVNLDELVREIVRGYPMLQPDRARLEIAHPLMPVLGNTALLTQSISNLLGNAVKFVKSGQVPEVRVWTQQSGPGWVRFSVQDQGIGIAPEYLDRIWRIFERLHHEREYPGTGIGLSVVKKAVERMAGRVGVESQPGMGSTFWFELPHP